MSRFRFQTQFFLIDFILSKLLGNVKGLAKKNSAGCGLPVSGLSVPRAGGWMKR
jgi:hypothetical protein